MLQLARRALFLTLLTLAAAGGTLAGRAEAAVRQVYLIQNSGWMEPFYADPASPFRPFVRELVAQSRLNDVDAVVASFNQDGQVPGRASPNVLFSGPWSAGGVSEAIERRLDLPRQPSGALADTDYSGALTAAFDRLVGPGGGIVWMVANNRNSPDNSQDVISNTRAFYAELSRDPQVTRISAFLVRMPVQGPHYAENGLIVYAIARGADAGRALDLILSARSPLRTGLLRDNPPMRLRPLERQPVELRITRTLTAGDARAEMVNGVLVISGGAQGRPTRLRLAGELVNTLYPYRIEHAMLRPVWTRVGGRGAEANASAMITPAVISNLSSAPGASTPVTLDVALPPLTPRDLLDDRAHLDGLLEVRLTDVRLDFDPSFQARAAAVFGSGVLTAGAGTPGALPDLFYAHRSVTSAATQQPVRMLVEFSALPLWAIGAGCFVAAALILALLAWMRRPVSFDSRELGRTVTLRKSSQDFTAADGRRTVRITRGLFGGARESIVE